MNWTEKIKNNEAIGVDVRSAEELTSNPAPGATHIPLDQVPALGENLDKNKTLLVFCEVGARASKAQFLFEEMGFKSVENIGDWRAWNQISRQ